MDEPAADLAATAWSMDGEVMALAHRMHPTFGLQFHPESVLTEHGYALMRAFLDRCEACADPGRVRSRAPAAA